MPHRARDLRPDEVALLRKLLGTARSGAYTFEHRKVSEHRGPDGLVLRFQTDAARETSDRQRIASEGVFVDASGTPLSFALLFADEKGNLTELELYNADGSQIIEIPDLSKLLIT